MTTSRIVGLCPAGETVSKESVVELMCGIFGDSVPKHNLDVADHKVVIEFIEGIGLGDADRLRLAFLRESPVVAFE